MSGFSARLLTVAMIAILAVPAVAGAKRRSTEEWTHEKGAVGNAVFSRRVEGARIREYKVEMTLDAPVEDVWAMLTDWDSDAYMPRVLEQRVLSGGGSDVVLYQKDDCSPLEPRDYALRVHASRDGATYSVRAELANDQAPAPAEGVVRIADHYREWTLTADGDGSVLTMILFYDPAGKVPDKLYNAGVPRELLGIKPSIEAALAAR